RLANPRGIGLLARRHGELLQDPRERRQVAQDELALRSPGAAGPHRAHPAGSPAAARLADADDERGGAAEHPVAAARLRRRADDGGDLALRTGRGIVAAAAQAPDVAGLIDRDDSGAVDVAPRLHQPLRPLSDLV